MKRARIFIEGLNETVTRESFDEVITKIRNNKFIEVFNIEGEKRVLLNSDMILGVSEEEDDDEEE